MGHQVHILTDNVHSDETIELIRTGGLAESGAAAQGKGTSKRKAERDAAHALLEQLNGSRTATND